MRSLYGQRTISNVFGLRCTESFFPYVSQVPLNFVYQCLINETEM